jgi:hypothetical protein
MEQKEWSRTAIYMKILYYCNMISIPVKSFAHPGLPEIF